MSNLESRSFCRLSEYDSFENLRLPESELQRDELYMLMIALRSQVPSQQAAKMPIRINGKARSEGGLWTIRMGFLDVDLKLICTIDGQFNNGLWQNPESMTISNIEAQAGYLKGFADEMDDGLRQISEASGILALG